MNLGNDELIVFLKIRNQSHFFVETFILNILYPQCERIDIGT